MSFRFASNSKVNCGGDVSCVVSILHRKLNSLQTRDFPLIRGSNARDIAAGILIELIAFAQDTFEGVDLRIARAALSEPLQKKIVVWAEESKLSVVNLPEKMYQGSSVWC